MMGSTDDPPVDQGPAVAATVFSAVIVYAVRLRPTTLPLQPQEPQIRHFMSRRKIFGWETSLMKSSQVFLVGCAFQAYLHICENRRGAISLS